MKVQLLSDLHFEFLPDRGRAFVKTLDPSDVDVLILAGDLTIGRGLADALDLLCEKYASALVIYLPGNHEYYGCSRVFVQTVLALAESRNENLYVLNPGVVDLDGVRFVGATLWFPFDSLNQIYEKHLSDFSEIRGFASWVYEAHSAELTYLRENVRPGDVVITHYIPCGVLVADEYVGSELNRFFVGGAETVVDENQPAVWCYGHTHTSLDWVRGRTRFLCNPLGYPHENRMQARSGEFDPKLVFETSPGGSK